MQKFFMVVAIASAPLNLAYAADICRATVMRDVAAIGSPESVLKKGQFDEDITQYQVDKATGQASFCSHGGYCYPERVEQNGDHLLALKLINCRVASKPVSALPDDDSITYEVLPIREKVSKPELRRDDLEKRFLQLGLCSSCADNVAQYYVAQPNSQCAVLAKRALEGDPDALKTLQEPPSYCVWHYPENE